MKTKIIFLVEELAKIRGGLFAVAGRSQEKSLHFISDAENEHRFQAYDDKNTQMSSFLQHCEIQSDEGLIDKWLDISFLDIVNAYAGNGSEKIILSYQPDADGGEITIQDEKQENCFKLSEKEPSRQLDDTSLLADNEPLSTVSFEQEELLKGIELYGYAAGNPPFNGISIEEEYPESRETDHEIELTVKSLDGHRIAIGTVSCLSVAGEPVKLYITPDLKQVIKEMDGKIDILVYPKCLVIKNRNNFVTSIKKVADFPLETVNELLNQMENTRYGFAVSVDAFISALTMCTAIGRKEQRVICFEQEKDDIYLVQNDHSAKIKLPTLQIFQKDESSYEVFALKPEFLLETLKSIKSSGGTVVAIGVINSQSPVYCSSRQENDERQNVHIILPIIIKS